MAKAHPDPVTRDPGLGHLELRLTDAVPVTDTHLVVGQSIGGEVFPELAVAEVVAPEMLLPVLVGLRLVDEHGPHLAAVPRQVALAVTVDVEPVNHHRTVHGVLPGTGMDGVALPGDITGQANIHRQQDRLARASFRGSGS